MNNEINEFTIHGRRWVMEDLKLCQKWTSGWYCDDGDGAELYISKADWDRSFELSCFSGIPASKIYVDIVDFGTLWRKSSEGIEDELKPKQEYSYVEQCIILADWLCSMFCEWADTDTPITLNK